MYIYHNNWKLYNNNKTNLRAQTANLRVLSRLSLIGAVCLRGSAKNLEKKEKRELLKKN